MYIIKFRFTEERKGGFVITISDCFKSSIHSSERKLLLPAICGVSVV